MATKEDPKELVKIIAIGNPGAGKSALLNSLGGQLLFESGVNIGRGKTYRLDERKNERGHFLDTPGLADEELRKAAGKAISEGLRMGGQFKVLFFVTEQSGRVLLQDATTIQLIHDAAPEIGDEYGIIVNMVSKGVLKKLNETEAKHEFLNILFSGIPEEKRCIYTNVLFVGKMENLEDEDNCVVPPETIIDTTNNSSIAPGMWWSLWRCFMSKIGRGTPDGVTLTKFIYDVVPDIMISQEKVSDINVEKFNEITTKLEKMSVEMKDKDETWKAERRQFEMKRIKDAEEHKKKTEELLDMERKNAEAKIQEAEEKARKLAEEKLRAEKEAEERATKQDEEMARQKALAGKFPKLFFGSY